MSVQFIRTDEKTRLSTSRQ